MISLELQSGPYYVGDELEGALIWTPKGTRKPDAIHITLYWRASGAGRWEEGKTSNQFLKLPDQLISGQAVRLPFRLRLPAQGPISYKGKLLRIAWRIAGEVDLPWAVNERVHQDLEVLPRPVHQADFAS